MSQTTETPEGDPIERVISLLDEIDTTLAEVREIAREMKDGDTGDCPRVEPNAHATGFAS